MKKLFVFLTTFFLALASASYLYYTHWYGKQQAEELFPYIPQSAALVYEVAHFGQQWESLQEIPVAEILDQLPSYITIQQALSFIKGLLKVPRSLDEVPLTVSIHGLSEEYLGCVFYFNMHNTATRGFIEAITSKIERDDSYKTAVRNYAGRQINELSQHGDAPYFSYIRHGQYIIASFSSLLIEDVVRGLANNQKMGLERLKKTNNAAGSLYVNVKQLPQILRIFVKHGQADALSTTLATFTKAIHLNLQLTKHHLLLSGFTNNEKTDLRYLTHTLADQSAGSMLLAPYIPQNTILLQHFTFSDAEKLLTASQQYRSTRQGNPLPAAKDHNSDLFTNTLYPLLQGEIGHCTLTTSNTSQDQLVFIKVSDTQSFIEALKGANWLSLLSPPGTHQPISIYQLTTHDCQHWLPASLFPAFSANCMTQMDDYIVLANSQTGLQTWYTQYQQGKTWAHAAPKAAWLESTLDQAQYSLFIDLHKAWPQVTHALKPTWKQVAEKNVDALQQFKYANLQLLHEQETGCYMSILLSRQASCPPSELQPQCDTTDQQDSIQKGSSFSTIFTTEAPIVCRPCLVKSHRDQGHHILLQDASHQLYFLDPTGKLLWKKALEGPMTTCFFEVDYYKNNKTQYLFATDKQLHLLDYYGRNVIRYPHPLPKGQPTHLHVADYNQDKNYRFLVATIKGDIYLKDKYYRPLPAWSPLALGQEFAGTPLHLRVQGKDYFLALQTNGTLQALNRKSKSYPGFPIDLKAVVHNPLMVRKGKTADETSLIVLTDAGQRMHLNLVGQVQDVVQLDRFQDDTRFTLCPNHATGQQYAIMRQDGDRVTIMNEEGNSLFELQTEAQNLLLQYYHFDSNHQFYILINRDQHLTYLYDHKGRLLQDSPWHNGQAVSLLFSEIEKELQVYVGSGNLLVKYQLCTP